MQQLRNKQSKRNSLFDEDFSAGFEDSGLDKVKPVVKVLIVVMIVVGVSVSGLWVYGNYASKNNIVANSNTGNLLETHKPVDAVDDASTQFNACTQTISSKIDQLQVGDSEFSKKLIGNYDEWLECYDKYPEPAQDATPSRSSLEFARKSAIDSSGAYRDTYISSNSYEYKPSTYTPTYSPDKYEPYQSNSSSTPTDSGSSTAPSQSNTVDAAWCNSKKSEVDSLYAEHQAARNAVDTLNTKIYKVASDVRQRYAGTSLNESQLQNMIASEKSKLEAQKTNLVAQQNSAKAKYDAAQRDYSNKGCYSV